MANKYTIGIWDEVEEEFIKTWKASSLPAACRKADKALDTLTDGCIILIDGGALNLDSYTYHDGDDAETIKEEMGILAREDREWRGELKRSRNIPLWQDDDGDGGGWGWQ
jgi:hypothetical protein